ncbi:MAG TPA: alpha/beta hydrolase [Marinobacter sp.]|nr:alpha/beta hydrolase [Marinobacter sp.]
MIDAVLPESGHQTEAGYREVHWPLENITLSGLAWPCSSGTGCQPPVLMVHGWLDNAMSFARLAPELAKAAPAYAVDMAGHGWSGHRPQGYGYWLMDYVADLTELIDTHFTGAEPGPLDLVGHSLGGIVCALYAAVFPERVRRLVMIDSLGAISTPAADAVSQLRRALQKKRNGSAPPVIYPDVATAARIREGGFSPLSTEAAGLLVPRNMRSYGEGYIWRTDSRLRHPSPLMMTEQQVEATLSAIQAPTLFVRARDGLLAQRKGLEQRASLVSDLTIVDVPGGHHCHLDGETALVSQAIKRFLFDV